MTTIADFTVVNYKGEHIDLKQKLGKIRCCAIASSGFSGVTRSVSRDFLRG